jgi:hypothetical protein
VGGNDVDSPGDGSIGPLDPIGGNGGEGDKVETVIELYIFVDNDPLIYSHGVFISATVRQASDSGPPLHGWVWFVANFDSGSYGGSELSLNLGGGNIDEFGIVVINTKDLGVGTWRIQAVYEENDDYKMSFSETLPLTVRSRCFVLGCDKVIIITPPTCTEGGYTAYLCRVSTKSLVIHNHWGIKWSKQSPPQHARKKGSPHIIASGRVATIAKPATRSAPSDMTGAL